MIRSKVRQLFLAAGLVLSLSAGASAQDDYKPAPLPSATPFVVSTWPETPPTTTAASPDIASDLAAQPQPTPAFYTQGVLVETLDGKVVMEQAANQQYNPASVVKLATAYHALQTFGPNYRFSTVVWTNGTFDQATGTITGDLIISGRDPSFHYEHAVAVARELNRLGVRTVTGDLIVPPKFTMNFSWSAIRSGELFYDTLDATRRPAAATRAWFDERLAHGDTAATQTIPSVAVMGAVYVAAVPPKARVLLTHRSSKLVDVLKVLLCYSNNFMAERLGDNLGGAAGVQHFLISKVGLAPGDVRLSSTSGLGVNRLSPRSMMKVYRGLLKELAKHNLSPSDIMPVAGIDPGTLHKRYTFGYARGSVIGKTGTLGRTDGGASALAGQMRTQTGETLLFVIFNQRGNVARFREAQDRLVSQLQFTRGGPAPFAYSPQTLAMRLSDTEVEQAEASEFEPDSN
ncbi:MAG TPA: D-alanyl-D-alanine carboxypeptidase [Pyrinomonadaceae bacterium]|jgi:D-alanyl-D-alanine carboxypeptidase/D-alanyl-D-alanine-endopeptidase (penicillin-binding protein 4)|nr:D-alanyl-D-alanine carboxypeptidase [Pyrinomonadaceae bacterium]